MPTRLGDAQIVFRLARDENGAVVPWYPHEEPRRAWALSEVSVRATRLKGAQEDQAVKDAKKNWPAWDQDIPMLLLRPDGAGRWRGFAVNPREQRQSVTYDTICGLILSADAP
jgi:CRISPR-associated endonuclease/helicase Cas3